MVYGRCQEPTPTTPGADTTLPEPEALARIAIERQLEAAGWLVQDGDESLDGAVSLVGPDVIATAIIEDLPTDRDELSLFSADLADTSDAITEVAD